MNFDEIRIFEQKQAAKVELSLMALNEVAQLDNALLAAQHKAMTPKQVVEASRKRKRMKALARKLTEAIYE